MTIYIDSARDDVSGCLGFSVSIDADGDFDITHSGNQGIIVHRKQAAELLRILKHYVETGELPETK